MSEKQIQKLTLESILQSEETFSEVSMPGSFDMQDIMKQNLQQSQPRENYEGLFQDDDDSASVTLTKKSQTTKTISRVDQLRSISVVVKENNYSREFVLKQTPIDQKVFEKNVTFMNIKNVSKPFETTNKFVGLPTSIFATSSKFLAIGTSQSSVVLFEMGVKNYKLLETVNKNKYGSVTSITISKDNLFMVCGYQNGYLTLWDLSTFSLTKTIQSQINTQSILKVEFIKNNEFISSDIQGNVMIHTVQKYVWTSLKSKRFINKSPSSVYYDIRTMKLLSGRYSLLLISFDSVLMIAIDPVQILYKFQRPDEAPTNSVPVADIGMLRTKQGQKNYILISWGNKIYVYVSNPSSRIQPFELVSTYQHNLSVLSIQIISSTSYILLDSTGAYRIINLISYIENGDNFIKCQGILKNDILTGKCTISDNMKQKNTANTICKTIQNFNQIFFITEGGMFRCRFHKWTEMIYYLIESKQYLQALKCAIQIFNGRLDIFSQKVIISPKTMVLFNDMIMYYLSIRLKAINSLTDDQLRQTIMTSIEFCIKIHSYDHLFGKVFTFVDQNYRLQKLFIQCLEPFIRNRQIKRITSFVLLQKIINFYAQEDPDLVDILILSLDTLSIDYFATLDVCVDHKLYKSLVYVSELNGDFVSPANKIIETCVKITDKGGKQQLIQEYTSLIYLEMIKLLQGKTIAETPLSQKSLRIGISTLSLWFTIQENARQLVNFNGLLYFQILESIFSNDIAAESFQQQQQSNALTHKLFIFLRGVSAGFKEYQEALTKVVLKINERWSISNEMVEYVMNHLQNLGGNTNKFIDKNAELIQTIMQKQPQLSAKIPESIQAQILLNNKKYKQALDIFYRLPQQNINILFQRLNAALVEIQLQRLVDLDPDATAIFLYENLQFQKIPDLFEKITPNVNSYLMMRRLKRKDINNKIVWKKSHELFYFQSLCRFKPQKRVLYELQSGNKIYRQQMLTIVKKYKLKQCQALLSPSQHAFSLYKQIYVIRFASQLQKLVVSFKYSNASQFQRVLRSVFKLLQTHGDVLDFFRFILKQFTLPCKKKDFQNIGKQIQDIANKMDMLNNPFIKKLKWMIQEFIKRSLPLGEKQVSNIIFQNKEIFALKFISNAVYEYIFKSGIDFKIFKTIQNIIKNDDISKFDKLLQQKAATFFCRPICRACSLFLTEGPSSSLLFSCGHCFHLQCIISSQNCQICQADMFLKKNERRATILLQESRRRNQTVKQISVKPMYSYIEYQKMIQKDAKKENEEDWELPSLLMYDH